MARGTNKTKTTRPPREQTTERKERVRSGKTAARPDQVPADRIFLGEQDLHFFNEGTHVRLYEKLGAHPLGRGRRCRYSFRGVGTECRAGLGDWRVQ